MKACTLAVLLATSLVTGCGMFGGTPPPAPVEKPTPVVDFMIRHQVGETGTVDDPEFGQNLHIAMQDSFNSAKGEVCKRATLTADAKQAEMVVICRKGDDPWKMAPRIWGQGIE